MRKKTNTYLLSLMFLMWVLHNSLLVAVFLFTPLLLQNTYSISLSRRILKQFNKSRWNTENWNKIRAIILFPFFVSCCGKLMYSISQKKSPFVKSIGKCSSKVPFCNYNCRSEVTPFAPLHLTPHRRFYFIYEKLMNETLEKRCHKSPLQTSLVIFPIWFLSVRCF